MNTVKTIESLEAIETLEGRLVARRFGISLEDGASRAILVLIPWSALRAVTEATEEGNATANKMLDIGWHAEPVRVDTTTRTNGATWHVTMTGEWTGMSHMSRRQADEGSDLPNLALARREALEILERLGSRGVRGSI